MFSRLPGKRRFAALFRYQVFQILVRGDRDSRANLMPIHGDLYQIKL